MPKRRVLIVDDTPSMLAGLKDDFQHAKPPWSVKTASTESSAVKLLSRWDADVVVCDLVLAGTAAPPTSRSARTMTSDPRNDSGGMAVLRYAKDKEPLRPVILYTSQAYKLQRKEAFTLGAYDCIEGNARLVLADELLIKANAAWQLSRLIDSERRVATLQRYFDPGVFKMLQEKPDLLKLRKATVTACFWDVRKFSELCDVLKGHPECVAGFLRDYFEAAARVIFENGGVLDKFMGDGVLGLFGALTDTRDKGSSDAINAVNAACAMTVEFEAVLERWKKEWQFEVPREVAVGLGCGIHTGEVLVGNVGTEMREEYTALGANVNVAQRLMTEAKNGQIIISISTQARVEKHFHHDGNRILKDVKNMPGDFRIWNVRGKK